jgi:hypothetical protein
VFICLLYALFSFNVKEFFRTLSFLVRLFIPGSHIHHKSFTFQQGPTCTEDGGIEYCKDCPDATVRNGTMVPVCLADYLFPLAEEPTGPACAVG